MEEVKSHNDIEITIIPRSVYLNIIKLSFTEIDVSQSIPAHIYDECDKILGVRFITVLHMAERSFKCAVVDSKKWFMARLKYGV
jgi:hypothetical protein